MEREEAISNVNYLGLLQGSVATQHGGRANHDQMTTANESDR